MVILGLVEVTLERDGTPKAPEAREGARFLRAAVTEVRTRVGKKGEGRHQGAESQGAGTLM